MKILSDMESFFLKLTMAILAAALIALILLKAPGRPHTTMPAEQTRNDTIIVHDTITLHDTIVSIQPITNTVYDTIYITE